MSIALLAVAAATSCVAPPGWDAVARRGTRYVVFGESHGTAEGPAFVGRVACALARRGQRVLIAIEQGSTLGDAALQAAWALPDDRFVAALRTLRNWTGRRDGVGSQAMFALLVRLHRLNGGDRRVDVVAFNGARDDAQRARFADQPLQGPHEAAQAENIRIAASRAPYDSVLVLVGELHAQKRPQVWDTGSFRPMAMQLAPAGEVTSLQMRYAAGATAWQCRTDGSPPGGAPNAIKCAAYPLGDDAFARGRPRIALRPKLAGVELDPAFDGYWYVGSATASPPQEDAR